MDLAGEEEEHGRRGVRGEADGLLGGVEAGEGVVDEETEGGQDDHAQSRPEVAAVDRGGEDGDGDERLVGDVGRLAREAPLQPAAHGLLHGEERRGEQDQPGHEVPEEALGRVQEQQAPGEAARERGRDEPAHACSLAGEVALLGQGRPQVAGGQRDRVRHVRGHRGQAEGGQGGEGDERAAARERVDRPGGDGGEPGEGEVERREDRGLHELGF